MNSASILADVLHFTMNVDCSASVFRLRWMIKCCSLKQRRHPTGLNKILTTHFDPSYICHSIQFACAMIPRTGGESLLCHWRSRHRLFALLTGQSKKSFRLLRAFWKRNGREGKASRGTKDIGSDCRGNQQYKSTERGGRGSRKIPGDFYAGLEIGQG